MPYTLAATALPGATLWGDTTDKLSVLQDGNYLWCAECCREYWLGDARQPAPCKHTAAVASALRRGTAPAPVRRKRSGGARPGAGRPKAR